MMPAALKDLPLRCTERQQLAKLIPAETGVRPEAREVNRIGRDIVPIKQLLLPSARIIVDTNELV